MNEQREGTSQAADEKVRSDSREGKERYHQRPPSHTLRVKARNAGEQKCQSAK
jgi:hypothetical protein